MKKGIQTKEIKNEESLINSIVNGWKRLCDRKGVLGLVLRSSGLASMIPLSVKKSERWSKRLWESKSKK